MGGVGQGERCKSYSLLVRGVAVLSLKVPNSLVILAFDGGALK